MQNGAFAFSQYPIVLW